MSKNAVAKELNLTMRTSLNIESHKTKSLWLKKQSQSEKKIAPCEQSNFQTKRKWLYFRPGFPLFRTDKIPWYLHDFSRFFSKFPGIFALFLKYDFQVVLNINMQANWVSFEQKINHFTYTLRSEFQAMFVSLSDITQTTLSYQSVWDRYLCYQSYQCSSSVTLYRQHLSSLPAGVTPNTETKCD